LYQPVRGTSSGSVYLVAALGDDLRCAVRINKSKLSIRVEGNVEAHQKALNDAGFKVSTDSNPYASAHLSINDRQTAMRTLGALLMAPGISWTTVMPDFNKLYLKGAG
jgi:hypothetical protein